MPIGGAPKMSKKQPVAPSYPSAGDLTPEELDALLSEGYVDYGDGTLIPPMDDNPYTARQKDPQLGMQPGEYGTPGWATANPGANSTGGPTAGQDIRSDIFRTLYRQGKRSGNSTLMDIGRPPMAKRGLPVLPGMEPEEVPEEPFLLELPPSATPPPREQWPVHLQGPPELPGAMKGPGGSRFPRATSLLGGARQMTRKRGR